MSTVFYRGWDEAFAYFNGNLFGEELGPAVFTMVRDKRMRGYCGPWWWKDRLVDGRYHEIALNPLFFEAQPLEVTLSTLVHEMVHAWQFALGEKIPSRGYHNREWAERMEEIGLVPSDSGEAGGRKTGRRMSHYIREGGAFARVAGGLVSGGWRIRLLDAREEQKKKQRRPKYVCGRCQLSVLGRGGLRIACLGCGVQLDEFVSGELVERGGSSEGFRGETEEE